MMELGNHNDVVIISNIVDVETMNGSKIGDSAMQELLVSNGSSAMDQNTIQNQVSPSSLQGETINAQTRSPYENIIANVGNVNTLTEAVNLSWDDINVFVTRRQAGSFCRKQSGEGGVLHILKNVTGQIESGSLVALMGSSGAGKSTLLNVLSHRNISNVDVSGTVCLNGKPVSYDINIISAYVQQEDLFIGTLTVREHLMFQALLRMNNQIPTQERVIRVKNIIAELGLAKCSNTVIGIPGRLRGISGGEKKRLSFASEILTDPALLFVDEPTSGLDSFMAQTVVATLHKLAKNGRTILATIHQPSSEVYEMFDNVEILPSTANMPTPSFKQIPNYRYYKNIILLSDGRVAYIGSREEAIPYFKGIGYPCPTNYNPADYFIQILSFIPEKEEESQKRIEFICDKHKEWEDSHIKRNPEHVDSFGNVLKYGPRYQAGWWTQFRVLFNRSVLIAKRDKTVALIRIMQFLFLGVAMGLIYLRLDYDQKNLQNFAGVIFFLITNLSFTGLQSVLYVFPVEFPVFLREHKNGMYRTDTYFLAKTFAEVPVFSLSGFVLILIAYWMIGLRDTAEAFFICCGIAILVINTATSCGYVISTISSSIETTAGLAPVVMIPLLIFGGFFFNNETVPVYFIWLRYLSWFNYGFENMMINQWDGYTGIACNKSNGTKCLRTGDMILKHFQLEKVNFNRNIYCMVGLFLAFRILAFLFLLRRARKWR